MNLALIKKENVYRGRADEFTKATLHGSIDQIAKKKEPIKLNDLFKDINDRCTLVLELGKVLLLYYIYVGSGKTWSCLSNLN